MAFNSQALLANLNERERIHGHHSPEGQAIRLLCRALSGWSSENLAATDVVVLCRQAVEDWLKQRLKRFPWLVATLTDLSAAAVSAGLLSQSEGEHLQRLDHLSAQSRAGELIAVEIEQLLETTIAIVEQHWS
ncbi:MAG: hypothetical protein ACXWWP_09825 [Candidatus Binatia bacterium]